MKSGLLLSLLLLAACGGPDRPRIAEEPLSPQQLACRDEARRSDARAQAAQQYNFANPSNRDRVDAEIAAAEQRAMRDCLVRAGVRRPGGVEAVRP
jgi:hypothetical protein